MEKTIASGSKDKIKERIKAEIPRKPRLTFKYFDIENVQADQEVDDIFGSLKKKRSKYSSYDDDMDFRSILEKFMSF